MSRAAKTGVISVIVLVLLVLAGVAARGVLGGADWSRGDREIPTVRVQRGRIAVKVHTVGDLRPARTAMLVAPPVSGTLQIVQLAKTGTLVEAGEVAVEFDPSEQEFNLEQARFDLLQAEQEITKSKADTEVQASQDRVALVKARFDVRRAELEVSRNELVSAIDAKKNELNREEAKRRLEQLEKDMASRVASNKAALDVLTEKRNKARLQMAQAQQNIDNMRLRSPIRGLVSVKENQDASGGFFFSGMVLPEYKEGDQVWPGRFLVEVLEVERMEIQAQVAEAERGNIQADQPVEVRVDAVPGRAFRGRVKTVAGVAARRFFGGDAMRRFDVTFEITESLAQAETTPQNNLRPGFTAQITILGEELKNTLYLPRQALFEKDGKQIVYVRSGGKFEPREVKVKHRTESHVVIEGLEENTEVALVNPEGRSSQPSKAPAPAGPTVTGGGR